MLGLADEQAKYVRAIALAVGADALVARTPHTKACAL